MTGFRSLAERTVFEGYVIRVAVGTFEGPDGRRFERDVIHHPGAVAVLPVDGDDVILVRQYRSALDGHLVEIPAGLRDIADEPQIETARRELIEEVGLEAGRIEPLASVHNAIGYCDEVIDIFVASELRPVERQITESPEELDMEILRIPIDDAVSMIWAGEITDAKTVIALLAIGSRGN
ncbi:MAG: NUDIX hydrolase [Acidimicrobiia bacterium]|nr:NUDIX hydrolase [Acidimicrobiia bacterium]